MSCGLTCQSQLTTPRPISGWTSSSSSLRVSSRRLTLFRLFQTLRRSSIVVDFLCRFVQSLIRIRSSLNRRTSSNTRSLYGPSGHSTNILFLLLLAGFRCCLDPLVSGGSKIVVGILIMPLVLLLSATSIACRPTSSTTTMGHIFLRVQNLVVGLHTRRRTRMVLLHILSEL